MADSSKGKGIERVLWWRLPCILNEAVSLHNVGLEIRDITSRLSKIAASMRDYGIKEAMEGDAKSST
ncbi:unnamed protein product [Arabis nemorensis]|uniref:Rx N-terminal domain-containing protein n=1 Tax=Arabis nemorensis TaxID=586526 RepID=A0A565CWQ1_9BRAS|nr:unnamed protein product [Arabis nemorensis]